MQFASITCILSGICKLCNMFHSTHHLKPTGNQERNKLLQLASLCKISRSTKQCNRHRAYIERWVIFCTVMIWKYNSLHNTDRIFTENNRAIISLL